jgi:hypothetical protein
MELTRGDVLKSEGSHGPWWTVVREILSHCVESPDAKDTDEGIQKFWLSARSKNRGVGEVRKALDYLVTTKGWMIKSPKGSSEPLYSLSKKHLEEIKDFFRQSASNS